MFNTQYSYIEIVKQQCRYFFKKFLKRRKSLEFDTYILIRITAFINILNLIRMCDKYAN